jgi:hypothetical protein
MRQTSMCREALAKLFMSESDRDHDEDVLSMSPNGRDKTPLSTQKGGGGLARRLKVAATDPA